MFKYFENKIPSYKLSNREKTAVSLRIDQMIVNKVDKLAHEEDRSRNFIINRLLSEVIQIVEKRSGTIEVDAEVLKQFRRPKVK